jgi:hypothetical protein
VVGRTAADSQSARSGLLTYDGNHFNQRGMEFVAERMLSKFK